MSVRPGNSDRRSLPRFIGRDLAVGLRQRGRLSRTPVTVLDFNRFGIAVLMREPLAKEKQIFLTLKCGEVRLDNVIGVVHNCIAQHGGYRCGIQFRTRSELQFDKDQVERALRLLEADFGDDQEEDADNLLAANGPNSTAH
jgi:hypothetical protein